MNYFLSPSPSLAGLSQTCACLAAAFSYIYMCIRISMLVTDSIADTCVARGSFFLLSLHPISWLGTGR